jgi:hypothetical protein
VRDFFELRFREAVVDLCVEAVVEVFSLAVADAFFEAVFDVFPEAVVFFRAVFLLEEPVDFLVAEDFGAVTFEASWAIKTPRLVAHTRSTANAAFSNGKP